MECECGCNLSNCEIKVHIRSNQTIEKDAVSASTECSKCLYIARGKVEDETQRIVAFKPTEGESCERERVHLQLRQ